MFFFIIAFFGIAALFAFVRLFVLYITNVVPLVESSLSSPFQRAAFLAASSQHSGDWLHALPIYLFIYLIVRIVSKTLRYTG